MSAPNGRYFSPEQARRAYDRIGRLQDAQTLYEHRATEELLSYGGFERARAVFELGLGTGALARRLFERRLPPSARYAGVDLSPRMLRLARGRLRRWEGRVELRLVDGSLPLDFAAGAFDRFVASYVLDLLSPDDIRAVLAEAHRLLSPEGSLCLTSLTPGTTPLSRTVTTSWQAVWSRRPALVGGCRPLELLEHVDVRSWAIDHRAVVTSFGVSSEVIVATRRP